MIFNQKTASLFFKATTILFLLVYIPSCFVYVISPETWWPMGILSIGFPYLWFFLLVLIFTWFFRKKIISLLLFLLLCPGWLIMKQVFALHLPSHFKITKKQDEVRIMQFNCMGFVGVAPYLTEQTNERYQSVSFIKKYNPDIICLQDFSDFRGEGFYSNIDLLKDTLGYRYSIFNRHYISNNLIRSWMGIAIFSKFPITDSGRLFYPGKIHPETILWANIKVAGKEIRVATTHLQSMHLSRNEKSFPLEQEQWQDSLVINHGSKIEKLRYFQPYHAIQAGYLRAFLDTCTMPLLFTSDLNSVASSYVYHKVKGNLTDGYLANCFGLGRTYDSWQPALRIDYIFCNKAIKTSQAGLFRASFSDHDPVLMDFSIH